jgi:methylmalonyl-CoA mutase N-terminal domain/subunit
LPAEESARIALRTQQIIGYETGVTNTTDPVGGSEYIENLTDEIEDGVIRILDEIEKTGGTLSAIETRWVQQQIQNAAHDHQRAVESGTQVVVDRLEDKPPPGVEDGLNSVEQAPSAPKENSRRT